MKTKAFSVYDSKAKCYMPPFFAVTAGVALRMFEQSVLDKDTVFSRHPGDFSLFELGEFNDAVGTYVQHRNQMNLGLGVQFIKPSGQMSLVPEVLDKEAVQQ